MNLILMGLPGADKDTQAEKIIDTYDIPHISIGSVFCVAVKDETTLGLEAKSYIDEGELVPDRVTNGVIKECLAEPDTDKGFLLDGSPRTLDQAKVSGTVLKGLNKKIDATIDIHVEEDILIERLAGRFIYHTCDTMYRKLFNSSKVEGTHDRRDGHEFYQRGDDKFEMVKNRLAVSTESSASILAFHKEQGLMCTIDGSREIDTVLSDVKKIIDEN